MSILQADSIQKSFKDKVVLSDVFLKCQQGEIVGVFGRNGSGKSTLFKIIFGMIPSASRFVKMDQKVLQSSAQTRKYVNYLPEHGFLPGHVKVESAFVLFHGSPIPEKLREDNFLSTLLQKRVGQMSFGERRFVEILLILYSKARFALLDEPFKGLSPLTRDLITEHIKVVKPEKGLIISDHDAERMCEVSDTLMFLENGFLKKLRNRRELTDLGYLPL